MRASWLAVIFTFSSFILATGQVAIGTNPLTPPSPDASAVLLLQGNGSQGLIVPIVTTLGAFGKQGMVVFNSTTNTMHYHNGTSWVTVGSGGGSNLIQISGNTITLGVGASSVNLATGFSNSARGFLYWNGTNWVQAQFTLPSTTQALVYDPATSTFGFQPLAAGGGISTLSTSGTYLSVTNPTGPTTTITANPITNSDISNTAAIAGSKINPNFGAQNISTTGTVSTGGLTIGTSTWPANAAGVLTNNGTGTLSWAAAPNPTLGGDLSGTAAAASVIRLQGQSVSATTPSAGQVLQYVSGVWTPANLTGGGTVTNVTATAPINVANGTTTPALTLNPLVDADISASAAIAGTKVNPAFGAQNITTTTGSASIGGGLNVGLSNGLQISNSGNFTRINNIATSFPAAQGAANTYLRNDGAGNLSWATVAGGSDVTAQNGVLTGNGSTITGVASLPVNLGGTGATSLSGLVVGNGTSAFTAITTGTNGQVLTVTAGVPSWQNATTSGAAGGDLTGTYPAPTIASGAITSGKLATNAVGTANIANAAVDDSKIANVAPGKILQASATSGQVLKWNGSAWAPAADAVGGGGAPTLNPGQIIVGDGSTNSGATMSLDATLNSTNGNVTVQGFQGRPVSNAVPATNSVYQFNGTQWTPVVLAGGGTVSSIATGTGLTGGPITGTGTISIAPGGVTSTELAAGAVANSNIAANAVNTSQIVDGTITDADISGTAAIAVTKLATGTNGQVLTVNAGVPSWQNASGLTNPMTTAGDLIYGGVGGTPTRLAPGTGFLKGGATPTYSAVGLASTDVTGVLPIANGGTGAATAPLARTSLGLGSLATLSAVTSTEITDGTITDADISGTAAIAGSKINANFGAGNVATSGTLVVSGAVSLSNPSVQIGPVSYTWPGTQGAAGTVLTNNGTGTLSWGSTLTNPMTTPNDLIIGGAAGAATRLAAPGNNQVLTSNGSGAIAWAPQTSFMTNPLTTNGDIIYGVGSTPTRLAAGTGFLKGGAVPSYSAVSLATADVTGTLPVGNGGTGITTFGTGGLLYASGATTMGTIGNGTAGQMLLVTGTTPTWQSMGGDATITGTGSITIANSAITDVKVAAGAAIAGSKIAPNFGAQNVVTTGTLTTGTAGAFAVDATGNITKIRNVTTSFPAANAAGVLTNDGTGTLTWAAGSGWGLTGNAGTNPATNFIGTTDAQPLRFATGVGGTERMRLDATGNLGFGVTTPLSKFHIKQSAQVNDVLTDAGSGFFGSGLMFENSGTTDSYYVGYGNGGYFRIGSKSAANVFTGMVYASPTGVGIFSPVPTEKLDVTGNIKFSGALMPNNLPGTAGQVLTSAGPGLPPTWSGGSGWALGGNTGTVDGAPGTGTNYIGTRDNIALNFMVNNIRTGRLDGFNVFFGQTAGALNTGANNSAIGLNSMAANTSGAANSALGSFSLNSNTTGTDNTAVGGSALRANTTGSFNSAVGSGALFSSTIGTQNAANGINSLYSNVSGNNNTAIGYRSMFTNTTGSNNTAVGFQADVSSVALTNATAIGANASVTTSNTIQLGDAAVTTVNVGTGTTAKLVAGQLQITGGTLGAGRVLTSDASGNATWQPASGGSGWTLGGNTGTVDGVPLTGTNYIGTRDAVPLNLMVNSFRAGQIHHSNANTFFGFRSGESTSAAVNANTGIGANALLANTTGQGNTAIGKDALQANTTGNFNMAVGTALTGNSAGNFNVAMGYQALNVTTASDNSAFGSRALINTTAGNNTAIGSNAGTINTTGTNNTYVGVGADANAGATGLTNSTAIGAFATVATSNTIQLGNGSVTTVNVGTGTTAKLVAGQLQITGGTLGAGRVLTSDASGNATWQPAGGGGLISSSGSNTLTAGNSISTAGIDNAIFGNSAGAANTGNYNVIIGQNAALSKTGGDLNTIIGWYAGNAANTAAGNTLIGAQAGESTTGSVNTFIGEKAGQANTTGNQSVYIGNRAGDTNTTGDGHVVIGNNADVGSVSLSNAAAIGFRAQVNQSNSLVLGSINGLNGATASTNVGIGTNAPAQRLHVSDPGANQVYMRITNSSATSGLNIGLGGAGVQEAFIANNQNAAMYFQTNATNRMTITAGGNIGIGTISPNAALQFANVLGNRRLVLWESANNDHEYYGFGVNGGEFRYQIPNNAGAQHRFYAGTSTTTSLLQMSIGANGNVAIAGSLSKGSGTFKIDHPQDPENKYLYHSFVGSPDMMNVYNGNITTDVDGNATVELPAYFESLNKDFRYQLTVIGAFAQAIIASEVKDNKFVIKTDKANVKVSWQVTGIRKDPYAEQNRVVPEVEKPAKEKGKYLHPEAYGLPLDRSVNHVSDKKENN